MQTFAPLTNLTENARCIDLKRLGKQVIESRQIGKALFNPNYGWQNHPATNMWRGHEIGLLIYNTFIHREWQSRRNKQHQGYLNMLDDYNFTVSQAVRLASRPHVVQEFLPEWWGTHAVHESHRSNLLRKDRMHYEKFFNDVPNNLDYVWPV